MKVTIVIPCYNQAEYLPETLDSVLAQTYADWECIIVNDGSLDNTEEVASEYCQKDDRFKYLHKPNGGLSSARNYGIKHSAGAYILPLDSDDTIERGYLSKAIQILDTNPSIGIVYCRANLFGLQSGEWQLPAYNIELMIRGNVIFCSGFFRRVDYQKTVGYREAMRYGYEDWDFWLSLIELGVEVYRIDEILFNYRIRKKSMLSTIDSDAQKNTLGCIAVLENHIELYAKYAHLRLFENIATRLFQSYNYRVGARVLAPIRKLRSLVSKKNSLDEK